MFYMNAELLQYIQSPTSGETLPIDKKGQKFIYTQEFERSFRFLDRILRGVEQYRYAYWSLCYSSYLLVLKLYRHRVRNCRIAVRIGINPLQQNLTWMIDCSTLPCIENIDCKHYIYFLLICNNPYILPHTLYVYIAIGEICT